MYIHIYALQEIRHVVHDEISMIMLRTLNCSTCLTKRYTYVFTKSEKFPSQPAKSESKVNMTSHLYFHNHAQSIFLKESTPDPISPFEVRIQILQKTDGMFYTHMQSCPRNEVHDSPDFLTPKRSVSIAFPIQK